MTEFSVRFDKDKAMRDALRQPFHPDQIGKLPASAKRPALDYVGHAATTDRLNYAAPGWHYTVDEMFTMSGQCWIRGTMTVGEVSRVEYGDGKDPKEAIGNFIRRGAMRYGVALDLWSKEELHAEVIGVRQQDWGRVAENEGSGTTGEAGVVEGALGKGAEAIPAESEVDITTPATPQQWDNLLKLKDVGGSAAKALSRINRVNKTGYKKETVKDATVAEVAKAIVG